MYKKWTLGLLVALTLSLTTGLRPAHARANTPTAQPTVQSVQIVSTANGYQINVRLNNDANVKTIDFGTQNPFGGMPADFIFPNVQKAPNGTWTASLGPSMPTTLILFRRLWIKPQDASGRGPIYRWENDFNITYKVAPGDSLYRIAKAFNVPLPRELAANPHFGNPDLIYPDEVVNIPRLTPIPPQYTVATGDSLFTIATKFGVSLSKVIAANPQIQNPNLIYPGQTVKLPQLFY